MSSTVYYRLKDAPGMVFKPIRFDGVYLPCIDLKRKIIYQEGFMRAPSDAIFDLELSDAQTSSVFTGDTTGVRRNTCLVVKRVYGDTKQCQKLFVAPGSWPGDWNGVDDSLSTQQLQPSQSSTEEDHAMRMTMDSASRYSHAFNQNAPQSVFHEGPRRIDMSQPPPASYVCHRCKKSGHWIKACPTNGDARFDKTSQIKSEARKPSTSSYYTNRLSEEEQAALEAYKLKSARWLKKVVDKDNPETMETEQLPNWRARWESKHIPQPSAVSEEVEIFDQNGFISLNNKSSVPSDLKCNLCQGPFSDACVMTCCFTTFCRACISKRLKQTPSQCPSCDTENPEMNSNSNLQRVVDDLLKRNPHLRQHSSICNDITTTNNSPEMCRKRIAETDNHADERKSPRT